MFCRQCGARLEEGARFCSTCGVPVLQETPDAGQSIDTAAESGPMASQQPEANKGGYTAPQEQAPYGGYAPPPGGYPPYENAKAVKKPMSKKAKGLMWGGIGLAAALAIAAVLVFVVFAGGAGLLSGNTVQTRFVNEAAKVFAGAFADFSVLKTADVSEQPFDMELSVKVKGGGLSTAATAGIDVAYDKLNLGAAMDIGFIQMKLLVLEDTLYMDSGYEVMGVRLDSDVDLSKPMGLKQRLSALTNGENTANSRKIAEAFLNSISADCFRKTGSVFTLELSEADMQDALEAFAKKLDQDEGLRDELESLLKDADIDDILEEAISSLDDTEFDLTIELRYKGCAPTALDIEIDSPGSSVEMAFGYEKKGGATVITLDVAENSYDDVAAELMVKRVSGGLELVGSIGSGSEAYDLEGIIEKSGNTLSGSFDISDGDDEGTLAFEYSVRPGMPKKAVEDDRRFAIDTKDAKFRDMEDALLYSMPFMWGGLGF
jgi:hypothetical protein